VSGTARVRRSFGLGTRRCGSVHGPSAVEENELWWQREHISSTGASGRFGHRYLFRYSLGGRRGFPDNSAVTPRDHLAQPADAGAAPIRGGNAVPRGPDPVTPAAASNSAAGRESGRFPRPPDPRRCAPRPGGRRHHRPMAVAASNITARIVISIMVAAIGRGRSSCSGPLPSTTIQPPRGKALAGRTPNGQFPWCRWYG